MATIKVWNSVKVIPDFTAEPPQEPLAALQAKLQEIEDLAAYPTVIEEIVQDETDGTWAINYRAEMDEL